VLSELDCLRATEPVGDSEIEHLLFRALQFRCRIGMCEFRHLSLEDEERFEEWDKSVLHIRSQVQLPGWRVDFIVYGYDFGTSPRVQRTPGWKRLIVECDGHEFHERTKEQAARDRARDREFQANGYEVFRFTGSEIWRDPMKCAEQITDWATRGWW
jgi:hypothetical protein